MNLVEHAIWALVLQTVIGLVTRNWWAGAALACGYFIGRELTQAEYRWIENFGDGLRANAPWWAAFDSRVWLTADQFADWIGPVVGTTALGLIAQWRQGK
jgi:hypothetical protein